MEVEARTHILEFLAREYSTKINCLEDLDTHLLGMRWNLPPWSLIYLMQDLEQKYEIQFSEEDVNAGKLYTVRKLVQTVCEKLGEKKVNES